MDIAQETNTSVYVIFASNLLCIQYSIDANSTKITAIFPWASFFPQWYNKSNFLTVHMYCIYLDHLLLFSSLCWRCYFNIYKKKNNKFFLSIIYSIYILYEIKQFIYLIKELFKNTAFTEPQLAKTIHYRAIIIHRPFLLPLWHNQPQCRSKEIENAYMLTHSACCCDNILVLSARNTSWNAWNAR